MAILPFAEWRPDVSDYEGKTSRTISGVVPQGDGYGPFKGFTPYTSAMAAACRGMFFARKADDSVSIFVGTATKLYNLNNAANTWTDVSKAAGTYTTLSTKANWTFAQFNNFVIACQVNAPVQVFNLASSTEFADLGGSPPQAAYVTVINRFLVLGGIASPNVYRVQWSALNDTTGWTSGVSQSDYQDLADGGAVRGIASGGDFGTILQDTAIRRISYAPGSPYVFGIERIAQDHGLYAPGSLVSAGDRMFYYSTAGFKMLLPGGYPLPIGKERVDRTFSADIDTSNLQLFIGAHDPKHTRVYWAYKSINGATGLFDKILVYDWILDRWTTLTVSGEFIGTLSQPGLTLEGVDAAYGSSIDALSIATLDDISTGSLSLLAGFNSSHVAGFYNGTILEANLRTPENGADGRRVMVRGFRPITDAATVYGSITYRETAQASASTTDETLVNAIGMCPQRRSTRYARGVVRIPSGTSWTYAKGIEPEFGIEGKR